MRDVLLVFEIFAHHFVAVHAINREDAQEREIGDQERPIEEVKMVDASEGVVGEGVHQLVRKRCS